MVLGIMLGTEKALVLFKFALKSALISLHLKSAGPVFSTFVKSLAFLPSCPPLCYCPSAQLLFGR